MTMMYCTVVNAQIILVAQLNNCQNMSALFLYYRYIFRRCGRMIYTFHCATSLSTVVSMVWHGTTEYVLPK
jgi:hypothetical protein